MADCHRFPPLTRRATNLSPQTAGLKMELRLRVNLASPAQPRRIVILVSSLIRHSDFAIRHSVRMFIANRQAID
jgi:hypothetical protein